MATVNIQKSEQPKNGNLTPVREPQWEPFRIMRDLLAWDPFRQMAPSMEPGAYGFMPSFDVKETAEGYVFKADVPGIKEGDLSVSLSGNRLTISGKRDEEHKTEKETYYTYERSYGSFTRAFTLPDGIDANSVRADLTSGVLTIGIKKVPAAQAKSIPIESKKG